jgi:hypothetical protein
VAATGGTAATVYGATAISFENLIAPIELDDFLNNYYERQPLVLHREGQYNYDDVLTIRQLDQWLASNKLINNDVSLVNANGSVDRQLYVRDDGAIDLAGFYQQHRQGATIVCTQMQNKIGSLMDLCRAGQYRLNQRCQTNLYLSPADSQGFKTHHDTHDVFVLQVLGSKVWSLYGSDIALPLEGQSFSSQSYKPREPATVFTLQAGDLFYCPRGIIHDARSTNTPSLHITFGVSGRTWADFFLECIAEVALREPSFRRNLPAGFAEPTCDDTYFMETFHELLDRFQREVRPSAVLNECRYDLIASQTPSLEGELENLCRPDGELFPDTVLALRPRSLYAIERDDSYVYLRWRSRRLRFPVGVADALQFVLSGSRFPIKSIPNLADESSKLVFAGRLVSEGLLERR